jgi:hypothetical protein
MESHSHTTDDWTTSDLTLDPLPSVGRRRRVRAPVLARAVALGLLALTVVGPPSASPALAAPPETGALPGFNVIIHPPPFPNTDALGAVQGVPIVAEPPDRVGITVRRLPAWPMGSPSSRSHPDPRAEHRRTLDRPWRGRLRRRRSVAAAASSIPVGDGRTAPGDRRVDGGARRRAGRRGAAGGSFLPLPGSVTAFGALILQRGALLRWLGGLARLAAWSACSA